MRPELELALGFRPAALPPGGVSQLRVVAAVERWPVELGRLPEDPLHLGGELGGPPDRCRLVEHAYLERSVLRPRPHVPMAACAVAAGRGLPVVPGPQYGRRPAGRHLEQDLGADRASTALRAVPERRVRGGGEE